MNKKDIKQDPVRDKILGFIRSVSDNKNKFLNYFLAITALLLLIIFYANRQDNRNSVYSLESSINQNKYIDGISDIAVDNFNDMIDDFKKSEAYNQAYIYLLNYSIENNDIETVKELIDNSKFSSSDNTLNALVYNLYGNYYLGIKDYENCEKFYKKSIDISSVLEHRYRVKFNLILLYLENEEVAKAKSIIDNIVIEDVVPYQLRGKYEQILSLLN